MLHTKFRIVVSTKDKDKRMRPKKNAKQKTSILSTIFYYLGNKN